MNKTLLMLLSNNKVSDTKKELITAFAMVSSFFIHMNDKTLTKSDPD